MFAIDFILTLGYLLLVFSVLGALVYYAPQIFNFVVGTIKWNLNRLDKHDYDDYE